MILQHRFIKKKDLKSMLLVRNGIRLTADNLEIMLAVEGDASAVHMSASFA